MDPADTIPRDRSQRPALLILTLTDQAHAGLGPAVTKNISSFPPTSANGRVGHSRARDVQRDLSCSVQDYRK